MRLRLAIFALISFSSFFGKIDHLAALSYPVSTPAGETVGGTYRTYFDNIFANAGNDCDLYGQVVGGFSSSGVPNCVNPVSSGLFLSGQTTGDTIFFNGTDWLRTNNIFNAGGNVGIGTTTPGAKLEINGQVKITGGSASSGRILTSDATGLAYWSDVAPNVTASGIIGGTQNYIPRYGLGGSGLVLSQIFDDGTHMGIGTATPSSSVRLDVIGDILVNTLRLGRGGGNILSNTVFGWDALGGNVTGTMNVALGYGVLSSLTFGDGNIGIGNLAGSTQISGSNNLFIGNNVQPNIGTSVSNQLNIGNWIYGNNGDIGIGVINPQAKLDINGLIKISGGAPGVGKILTSDATGLATWTGLVTATSLNIPGQALGTTIFYNGADWVATTNIYNAGSNVGIGTTTPGAKLEVNGQIKITSGAGSGKVLVSDAAGLASWQASVPASSVDATNITGGVPNYITKFGTGGIGIFQSLLYEVGGYIGLGNTNPTTELDINGQIRIRGGGPGAGRVLTSDATGIASWVNPSVATNVYATGVIGMNSSGGYLTKFMPSGSGITSALVFESGSYIGINTTNPSYTLDINGVFHSTGNAAIGGSLGVTGNTVLGGTIQIIGGSPGLGKILTSDATGLATWSTYASGATATGITGGVQNYVTKFGTGGNGIYASQIFDSGTGVGIGTASPSTKLDINGQIKIAGGSPGLGKILTSDATGLATWSTYASGAMATGITGGSSGYLSVFGAGGNGLYISQLFQTGLYIGVSTITPSYTLDVNGTGNFLGFRLPTAAGAGKVLTSDAAGNATWSAALSGATATGITGGVQNYVTKFGTGGNGIYASQIFDSGTGVGIGTASPSTAFDVNGQIRLRTGAGNGLYLVSDTTGIASWTGLVTATSLNLAGAALGTTLYYNGTSWVASTNIYNSGSNIGIGTATPSFKLDVNGSGRIVGDLTVQGKLITDTIVNRTVNNVSISGSLLPDVASPIVYRDIGSDTRRWNNLYLGGQIKIAGGSPGLGKILTSDASGLATWSTYASGAMATGITGGSSGYLSVFGAGGNGLYPSRFFQTGSFIGLNTITPGYSLDINGTFRNTGNAIIGGTLGVTGASNFSNTLTVGGATSLQSTLSVTGNTIIGGTIQIAGGSPGLGKILTSDASGLATWTAGFSGTTTASGITGGTQNYVTKFGAGGNGIISSLIYDNGTNIGIGTATPGAKFELNSGSGNASGFKFTQLTATSPIYGGVASPLGVDGSGNVVVAQQGAIPVYTALGATPNAAINTTVNPPTIGANYDKYFTINARQSFSVTDVGGNPYNCPEFTTGSTNKGAAGCTATPWASYVMTAQNATVGNRYAYQILISDRTDAPFVVRGGTYDSTQGKLMNTARTIEALWFKALTVPTNHSDWLYVNPGVDQNNNAIAGGGNVGIGTMNPRTVLEVFSGGTAMLHTRGANNTAFGFGSVHAALSGNANSGFGAESLFSLTTGYSNSAFGYKALRTTGAGYNNVAFGQEALFNNNGGSWNNALGYQALYSNSSGTGNVGIGPQALYNLSTGNQNIAIGYQALRVIAGSSVSNNIGIGYGALYSTTASNLVAVGYGALYSNSSGTGNTALGYQSLDAVTTTSGNTGLGYNTLTLTTGANNTAIGASAGELLTTGSNNIVIGANINATTATASNQLNIGNWIYGNGGNIGIGQPTPGAKLDVNGTIKITGGTPGVGKVLTSDASGLATWSAALSGATATGIIGGTQNYVPKFGTGGTGLYASQIFDNGTRIGIGTGTNLTARLNIDSGSGGFSGLRFLNINASSTVTSTNVTGLGINGSGEVVPISNGDVVVYDGDSQSPYPNPNPDVANRLIRYDFNRYFMIPAKQSFVVSDGNAPGINAPYIGENAASSVCAWNGTVGSGMPTCPSGDFPGSPYNSFTMSARSDSNYGYQIGLAYRGDIQLMARSGKFRDGNDPGTDIGPADYGSGLYLGTTATPAPWYKVLTLPTNHVEWFYIDTGYTGQWNTTGKEGMIGIGTTDPNYGLDIRTNVGMSSGLTITSGSPGVGKVLTSDASGNATWQTPSGGGGGGTTIIEATVNKDVPSVANNACSAQTFTVAGAAVGKTAWLSPASAITDGLFITYTRVSAANTVEAKFCNESGAAINLAAMDFYVSVIQ